MFSVKEFSFICVSTYLDLTLTLGFGQNKKKTHTKSN